MQKVIKLSADVPCIIFKHSPRCDLSHLALLRLAENWDFKPEELEVYTLDVIAQKDLSQLVADTFDVYHESPQLILIRNGECTYEAAHLEITITDLKDNLDSPGLFQ